MCCYWLNRKLTTSWRVSIENFVKITFSFHWVNRRFELAIDTQWGVCSDNIHNDKMNKICSLHLQCIQHVLYHINGVTCFALSCCVYIINSYLVPLCISPFPQFIHGWFNGTGAIIWFSQYQWCNCEGYHQMILYQTQTNTTKRKQGTYSYPYLSWIVNWDQRILRGS